ACSSPQSPSLAVRLDPDGLDHTFAWDAGPFARLLDAFARAGLEQAEHEFVARQVERATKCRVRVGGARDREPELVFGHAGPEALGRVQHRAEPRIRLSQTCPNAVSGPWHRRRARRDCGSTKMGSSRVEFRILGPLAVRVDGAPVPAGGPKQRAL